MLNKIKKKKILVHERGLDFKRFCKVPFPSMDCIKRIMRVLSPPAQRAGQAFRFTLFNVKMQKGFWHKLYKKTMIAERCSPAVKRAPKQAPGLISGLYIHYFMGL